MGNLIRNSILGALSAGLLLAGCGDDTSGSGGGGGDGGSGGGTTSGTTTTSTTTTTTTTTSSSGGGGEGGGVVAVCGDGAVEGDEGCDDGNETPGDGCGATCALENGYVCAGEPSECATDCGDGILAGAEACDDGNRVADDGCSLTCTVEPGFACVGAPSQCQSTCGDNQIAADEGCDDGNVADGDGCSAGCDIDAGWACAGTPSVCSTNCGDGILAGVEACDDGNAADGDGCSAACAVETGFTCAGTPSVCASECGDGILASDEACDDGDMQGGDCCSASCDIELGCETEPNNTIATADDFASMNDGGVMYGFVNPSGDVNYYMVTLASAGSITAVTSAGILGTQCAAGATTPPGVDTRLRIFDAMSATPIGADDDGGTDWCSALTVNVPPGTYYVAVDASPLAPTNGQTTFDYTIEITTQTYVCGDGTISPGEQCDDGQATPADGDGCSAMCQIETGYICVNEPSQCTLGGQGTACNDPFVATDGAAFTGSDIAQFGDSYTFDDPTCAGVGPLPEARPDVVFQIDLLAGQVLTVTEHGTIDAVLHILGTTCGAGACAASTNINEDTEGVSLEAMTTGTYYVVVESFDGNPLPTATFDVRFDVLTPVCGNGTIEPGETCDDGQATPANGDGCSATCDVEQGYTCVNEPSVCTGVLPGCAGTIVFAAASGLPAAIPDNQPNGGVSFPIMVAQTGTITDMAMGFSATHTFTADVDVYLTGPNMVQRNVCLDRGGNGNDFSGTVFRDDGASLATAVAPFAGVFAPEQAFSYFDGQSVNGTWTVRVADDLGSDVGQVTDLYLAFCVTP